MVFQTLQIISAVILIYTGLLFLNISTRQSNVLNIGFTSKNTYFLFALSSFFYGISLVLMIITVLPKDISSVMNIFKPQIFFDMVAGTLWILMIANYSQVKPRRLLWFICSIFFVLAILNLILPYGILWLEVTDLVEQNLPWGGTGIYFAGKPHPLIMVGFLNNFVTYGYFFYVIFQLYKRGESRKVIVLGFTFLITIISAIHIYLVDLQILTGVNTLPFAFLLMVIIMSFQLSNDIVTTQLQLEYYNNNLEEIIKARTKNLEETIKKNTLLRERNRITQKIHDSVSQTLHSLVMIADTLPKIWQTHPDKILSGLITIKRMAKNSIREMQTVISDLYPNNLIKQSLDNLIRQLAQKTVYNNSLKLTTCIDTKHSKLPIEVQTVAYQVIQESLHNIIRHSQAKYAEIHLDCVHLNCCRDKLKILIKDDGIGFNTDNILPNDLGINLMKESCEKIGAKLTIISKPNQGTKVLWECPVMNQEE